MIDRRGFLATAALAVVAPLGALQLRCRKPEATFGFGFEGAPHVEIKTFQGGDVLADWQGVPLRRRRDRGWFIFSGRRGKQTIDFRAKADDPMTLQIDWFRFWESK